jgi:hypothetical protein
MMGTREKLRGGSEYDALTRRGRRLLAMFRHSGIASAAKRRFWKRIRKAARMSMCP